MRISSGANTSISYIFYYRKIQLNISVKNVFNQII